MFQIKPIMTQEKINCLHKNRMTGEYNTVSDHGVDTA